MNSDLFYWFALMIVAGAVFLVATKRREKKRVSRRQAFLTRFKQTREGKRFYEDLKGTDKDFPGDKQ